MDTRNISCMYQVYHQYGGVMFKSAWETKGPWSDCIKADINVCSLGSIDPLNKAAWRLVIRNTSCLLPTQATGTPGANEN